MKKAITVNLEERRKWTKSMGYNNNRFESLYDSQIRLGAIEVHEIFDGSGDLVEYRWFWNYPDTDFYVIPIDAVDKTFTKQTHPEYYL